MAKPLQVVIEAGKHKVFASAVDWPGWCRSGKTEDEALQNLAAYLPRFAVVVRQADLSISEHAADAIEVVERLAGGPATDFGVPEVTASSERQKVTAANGRRLAALVTAAWAVFDEVASITPAQLRKGPRGGGRDRDKMIEHVLSAEVAYARKLGLKLQASAIDDVPGIETQREAIATVLATPNDGAPVVEKGWTTRYATRRIAWHALDHAWEMQDRTEPGTEAVQLSQPGRTSPAS